MEMDGNGNILGMTQPATYDADGNPITGNKISCEADGTFETTPVTWAWTPVLDTSARQDDRLDVGGDPGHAHRRPATFDFKLALTVDPARPTPTTRPQRSPSSLDTEQDHPVRRQVRGVQS